jgi:hypothetical protein
MDIYSKCFKLKEMKGRNWERWQLDVQRKITKKEHERRKCDEGIKGVNNRKKVRER